MDADGSAALARRSLGHLQTAFAKLAESGKRVVCVLVHTDIPSPELEFQLPAKYARMELLAVHSGRTRPATVKQLARLSTDDKTGQPIANPAGDPMPHRSGFVRSLYFVGEKTEKDVEIGQRYDELANAACLAMHGLPEALCLALWSDAEMGDDWSGTSQMWTEGLFDLGLRRPSGLPYACKRKAWYRSVSADVGLDPLVVSLGIPEPYRKYRWFSVLDDAIRASVAAIDYVLLAADKPPETVVGKKSAKSSAVRDKALDARDEWIYKECRKLTPYDTIMLKLKKKPRSWPRIDTRQGIRTAAIRYAERHGLEPIPRRQNL